MLTDAAIRRLKPRKKSFKVSDMHGLYLLVQPNGSRYWRMDYRHADKRGTVALGVYPAVSLKEAREKRLNARRLLDRASILPATRSSPEVLRTYQRATASQSLRTNG